MKRGSLWSPWACARRPDGVGMVKSEESVQQILDTLVAEAEAALSGR